MRNTPYVATGFGVLAILLLLTTISGAAKVAARSAPPPLSCVPKKLSAPDTLTLRFRMPHPAELAIRAPGNIWYFLVFEPDKSPPQPIIDKTSFAKMSKVRM